MNIFTQTHLPKDGWIQGCFLCIRPTSNIITYESKQKKNTVYLCKDCEKKNADTAKIIKYSLQIKLEQYISENTLEPFKARTYSLDPPVIKRFQRPEIPYPPPSPQPNTDINIYTSPCTLDDIV